MPLILFNFMIGLAACMYVMNCFLCMYVQVSNIDDVCDDEDELTNGRDECSRLWQAEENGNDSTKVR